MELFKASNQWATRPADERFWTLWDAAAQCREYAERSQVAELPYNDVRVEAQDRELMLVGKTLPPARLSHYAFGQLCQRGEPSAPASFLRQLKPTLAAQVLNSCLKERGKDDKASLLLQRTNGGLLLRASLSQVYERLWNHEIFGRLLELPGEWKVPPARPAVSDPRARPATEADVLGDGSFSVQVGDLIAPAGIYASDHDMFVFMVNEDRQVEEGLSRGFFLWNSEVGDKSFGYTTFLYNHVCGNHIVWGAKGVTEVRIRHIGQVRNRAFRDLVTKMRKFADDSVSDDRAKVAEARKLVLGVGKDEVVKALLGIAHKKRINGLSKRALDSSYEVAETYRCRYGDPNTLWAMTNAVTQHSQETAYADARNQLDRAASRLLDVV